VIHLFGSGDLTALRAEQQRMALGNPVRCVVVSAAEITRPLRAEPGTIRATTPPPMRIGRILGGALFVVFATAIQLLRQPGTPMWRTLWAEDGERFYEDAVRHPLREVVFRGYAGYAQVLPRIVAAIGSHVPLESYAAFVAVLTTALVSLLALFVFYASAPLLRSPLRQGVLAGAMLVLPVLPAEVLGAICNLHWMLPVPCLLAVLIPVERGGSVLARTIVVALAPLSSPLCLIFLPIALWRLVRHVQRRAPRVDLVVPLVYLAAWSAQIVVIVSSKRTNPAGPAVGEFSGNVAKLYGARVTAPLLFGIRWCQSLWDVMGQGLGALSIALVAAALIWKFSRSETPARWVISMLVAASAAVFVIEWAAAASALPGNMSQFSLMGSRFDVVPTLLLVFALLIPVDLAGTIVDPVPRTAVRLSDDMRRSSLILAVLTAWTAVAIVPSYRMGFARATGPDFVQSVEAAEHACERPPLRDAPILIAPKPWSMSLSCKQLAHSE
jgi:hypothetical protein